MLGLFFPSFFSLQQWARAEPWSQSQRAAQPWVSAQCQLGDPRGSAGLGMGLASLTQGNDPTKEGALFWSLPLFEAVKCFRDPQHPQSCSHVGSKHIPCMEAAQPSCTPAFRALRAQTKSRGLEEGFVAQFSPSGVRRVGPWLMEGFEIRGSSFPCPGLRDDCGCSSGAGKSLPAAWPRRPWAVNRWL